MKLTDAMTGCQTLDVLDSVQGARIPVWVLYPTREATCSVAFGPYSLDVAMNAPLVGEALPLVLISHGNGGTGLTHRQTAVFLAQHGFVVVLMDHPGNSRADNRLAFTAENLANRPRHVRLVLDAILQRDAFASAVDRSRIAVLGHSIGGYTALALAGGKPTSFPREEPDGQGRAVPVEKDERIARLILLAPASVWYREEGALREVNLPIFLRTGEHDSAAPPWHGELVQKGVGAPQKVDYQMVKGAGHFSFQSPFPPSMVKPDFPPSQDPPGFDRAAYQEALNAEILAFLQQP